MKEKYKKVILEDGIVLIQNINGKIITRCKNEKVADSIIDLYEKDTLLKQITDKSRNENER